MASFLPGGGVAAVSGSVGGTTFSRNRGGPYMRVRAIPVDPGTTYQTAVRAIVSDLTSRWLNTLTAAQRAAWDTYALNVELPGPLGNMRNVGGLAMYVRSNVPRLQASASTYPRVDDAPTVFNLGDFTYPSLGNASEAAQTASLVFDNTDDWANEDNAGMLVYGSRAQNASRNFFKGPYRQCHDIQGDSTTPPTSPATVTWPFPFQQGQRVFAQVRVTRADGRLSSPFRHWTLAIA
jgi:hypothetical protein